MAASRLARVARQAFPRRDQLATAGDRLEGVAAAVVAMPAIPVVGPARQGT
ncbi:hypothetical protein SAMN04488564_102109 [Lentzea waywayandensis]|uniref:Uncharacterized protein n=1 Tax=Lentzea waywayandensis TaxID=84724 RepID=A0A1I6DAG1_9PSEU|nr:hypothetical protein [Lentzea waywayandensis]SFR02419.1 hypothetical protein SAMN04488564_102109 [Lentzea waywayandensis]